MCSYLISSKGALPPRPVAFLAMLLEQARNVLIEGHHGRGRWPPGDGRSSAASQNAEQDEEKAVAGIPAFQEPTTAGAKPAEFDFSFRRWRLLRHVRPARFTPSRAR